jgi:hypothetical protein
MRRRLVRVIDEVLRRKCPQTQVISATIGASPTADSRVLPTGLSPDRLTLIRPEATRSLA